MKLTAMLIEWTLTSALLILAVTALRALLGKRVSALLRYALWAVVLARLLIPVQLFTTPVTGTSIMRETGMEQFAASPPGPAVPAPALSYGLPGLTALPDETVTAYQPVPADITVQVGPLPVLRVLGWLWLAGSIAMAAAFVLSNLSFARRLKRVRAPLGGTGCPLPVYTAEGLPSPCLFGLARPGVYVTPETAADPDMLRHVLAHEYTHFRHGDHVWNVLRSAALAIHWWNPLAWLAVALSRRDCELACDEGALKRLGGSERTAYGRTLLALLTEKPRAVDLLACATTMTGGQRSVWERVTRIAHAPKRWLWAAAAMVLAAALACVCAFGSAAEETPGPEPTYAASPVMDDLTADLTFSLAESDPTGLTVRMEGSVGDVTLARGGAFWYPETVWKEDASQELSMVYAAFTDGIEAHVLAWWANEERTAVTMSTQMTAMLSSLLNVGYWEFTVDLDSGTVTAMEGLSFRDGFPDAETRFYPASIPDGEAVKAARIAAKLLTAGEDYYNGNAAAKPNLPVDFNPIELDPVYTLDELGVSVHITGIDCTSAWCYPGRMNSYSGEEQEAYLDISGARCLGDAFYGAYDSVTARYDPEADPNLVWIHMYPRGGSTYVNCSVNLTTGEITEQAYPDSSGWEMVSPVLSNGEMLSIAQAMAGLIQGASDYYVAATNLPPEEGPLPFDTPMKLWFGSGAGAWSTILTLHPDGSFEGKYSDSDLGVGGPGFDSTQYVCQFHGRFGNIAQATAASWSMALEELIIDTGHPIGEEWIEPMEGSEEPYHMRYISSTPYGLDGGDGETLEPGAQFMFYTPAARGYAPGSELYGTADESSDMFRFWIWWPDKYVFGPAHDTLDCYALRSVETGYGFFDLHAWGLI